jgi:hypothetical protein
LAGGVLDEVEENGAQQKAGLPFDFAQGKLCGDDKQERQHKLQPAGFSTTLLAMSANSSGRNDSSGMGVKRQ